MLKGFISTSANKYIALEFAEQAIENIPIYVEKKNNIKVLI